MEITELQIAFPDGELYSAPSEDDLPPPVNLAGLESSTTEIVFHAAMAPMRQIGSNFSTGEQADGSLRFVQRNVPAGDWFTAASESELVVLQRCARVLPDAEPRDHLVSVPVVRLRRSATGVFEVDSRFIAPSLSIAAAPALHAMLRRLLDVLQAKVDALYGFHREPSRHVIEFRSGDIASFWLLHTASAAFSGLSHLHHNAGLHPERLFERMLELAGALMTFSKSFTLADLPVYRHASPADAFICLDDIIRELLETVSVASVEAAISVSLTDGKQQHNDWFQFYKSNAIALDDAVVIRSADLRVRRTPPHPALLVLNLEGRCITIDEVRGHFAPLRITGVPRGHSREELTTHSFAASWGRLSFSFRESNPTCVAVVVFHPAELR